MKRTDKLTKLIAILLFAAFLIYAAAYAIRALGSSTVTADVVAVELRPGGVANGIVLRDETVLTSAEKYLDVTARDGAKVAAGAPLATAMRSEAGLAQVNRIHALEQEVARVSAALEELDSAEDLTARDDALRSAVAGISAAVARHELGGMELDALNLRSLLFSDSGDRPTREQLRALEKELAALKASAGDESAVLRAETGGTFSTVVDGYEALSLADAENLGPSGLKSLLDAEPEPSVGAYGKLVRGFRWYFAAVMSEEDAARLTAGRSATLNFGRWYGADVSAGVLSISAPENGSVAVIFSCDTALADTLAMRCVSADVVYEAYTGLRVPAKALRLDPETGEPYVWCVTALRLERKNVTVLYEDGDFALIARDSTAAALREGNTVVVQGSELYEGKIME